MNVSIGHRLEPINSYILDGRPSVLWYQSERLTLDQQDLENSE